MIDFRRCSQLRTLAEQTCNPELYNRAAAEFEALGKSAAAARCRQRAMHYHALWNGYNPVQVPEQIAVEVR